jgi:ABC-type tungstate transport system substrate-binding protein
MMRIVGPLAALAAHAAVAAGVAMAMHVDRHVGVPVVIVGLLLFIPGSSESRENK